MRRVIGSLLVLAVAAAGCGGDGEAGSPLDEALGYLPENAAFAVAIDTDLEGSQYKAVQKIAAKFPLGDSLEDEIERSLEESGSVDFDKDVKPLLGNEFVVGAPDVASFVSSSASGGDTEFVGAIKAKDGDKLEELVKRGDAKEAGEKSGATIYEDADDDSVSAVEGDVLVVASSRKLIEEALERHDGDDKLDEEKFDEGLEGLPKDALLRAYADLEALLASDPDTRTARKIKWVDALRTFGLTASATENAVAVDFNVTTESGSLDEDDLPLAAGGEAPGVVSRKGEIALGFRDASRIVDFTEDSVRAVDPSSAGELDTAKRQIGQKLGIDVDRDLTRQLTGDMSVSVALNGDYDVRAEPADAARLKATLDQALPRLPRAAGELGGEPIAVRKLDGGLYDVTQSGTSFVLGVVDGMLVASNKEARARRAASDSPEAVSGAKGSFVLSADLEQLADALLGQIGGIQGLGGQLFTGPLGDATGSVETTTEGMSGSLKLTVD